MFTLKDRGEYKGATLAEKARVLAMHNLGRGSFPDALVIQAQIADRRAGGPPDHAVSPKDLGKFFMQIAHTPLQDRYSLLARSVGEDSEANGSHRRVWFDVIPGLTEPPIVRSIVRAASDLLPPHKAFWKHA